MLAPDDNKDKYADYYGLRQLRGPINVIAVCCIPCVSQVGRVMGAGTCISAIMVRKIPSNVISARDVFATRTLSLCLCKFCLQTLPPVALPWHIFISSTHERLFGVRARYAGVHGVALVMRID